MAFNRLRIWFLAATNEVGRSSEERYAAASKMMELLEPIEDPEFRHRALHRALDVILTEGKMRTIPSDDPLHEQFWRLGNRIARGILEYEEYLNISGYWFYEDYESNRHRIPHAGNPDAYYDAIRSEAEEERGGC